MASRSLAAIPPGWSRFPGRDGPGRRHLGPHAGFQLSHFHAYEQPLPEFPAFTHINEATCLPGHRLHRHHHREWEILCITGGHAELEAGGTTYRLQAGDLFITRPDEPHGGHPLAGHGFSNCAIGFDPARLLPPTGQGSDNDGFDGAVSEARACDDAFGLFGGHVIRAGAEPERICQRILVELDTLDGRDGEARARRLCVAMVQALLMELMVVVTRAGLAAAPPPLPRRRDLRELLAWIAGRLDEPPTLAGMAERIGLSPAHLVAVFRAELGRSPLEHVTELRIAAACERLARTEASVTAVAHGLGFCSSQYFSAVFRRRRGCTPSAWRRRLR